MHQNNGNRGFNKNILLIAAENSAESYAFQILDQFKRRNSPVHFFGIGGDQLAKEGMEIIIHNKELAVVGIIEVISSLFKLKKYMDILVKEAIDRKADAVILIDYPDFNLRLAKKMKEAGITVYYYISPTVWAWRYSRINLIKKYVDHIFIIFPFEIPIFEKEKISFTYTGHPLLSKISVHEKKQEFRKRYHIPDELLMVTLLPGSRKSEVQFLLPEMLKAMEIIRNEFNLRIFLLKASGIDIETIDNYLKQSQLTVEIINQEQGYDLINASDIILTTCGTSNLEIAIIGVPFVSVYRVNRLSYFLGKGLVKIKLYSIVNILAGKEVVRELIQQHFTSQNIAKEMRRILTNPEVRERMLNQFKEIKKKLIQDNHPSELIYNKIKKDLF